MASRESRSLDSSGNPSNGKENVTRFKKRQAHHFITTGLKKETTQV